jgi:hypothetical protein
MRAKSFGPPDLAWMANEQNAPAAVIAAYGKSGVAALNLLLGARRAEGTVTAAVQISVPLNWGTSGLAHRMKSPSSLARKLAQRGEALGLEPKAVAPIINDVLRYTVVSPAAERFADDVRESLQSIVRDGNRINEIDSSFVAGNPYMGVHAVSIGGIGFEVQYHTVESLAVKDRTHVLYEIVRDPSASLDARRQAFDQMASIYATVTIPEGIDAIEVDGVGVAQKIYRRPGGA